MMKEMERNETEILDPADAQAALATLKRQLARKDADLEREIEARQKLEEMLHEAGQSGHSLVENLSEVIYTTDAQGVLTYLSPAVEQVLHEWLLKSPRAPSYTP